MNVYPEVLFRSIPDDKRLQLSQAIKGRVCEYRSGDVIWHQGLDAPVATILLSGTIRISHTIDTNRRPLEMQTSHPGAIIGVSHLLKVSGQKNILAMASVEVLKHSVIYQFDIEEIFQYPQLVRNLLIALAERNYELVEHLTLLNITPLRDRVLAYLRSLPSHELVLNRNALASTLAVNRSALSRTLSELVADGTLHLTATHFQLLK